MRIYETIEEEKRKVKGIKKAKLETLFLEKIKLLLCNCSPSGKNIKRTDANAAFIWGSLNVKISSKAVILEI